MKFLIRFYVTGFMVALLMSACVSRPHGGLGPVVDWADVQGWQQDKLSLAWPALLQSCVALTGKTSSWRVICEKAQQMPNANDQQARQFFEEHFVMQEILPNESDSPDGLITGYYEPLLHGSLAPSERYRYPVYKRPDNLLVVELGELYPTLKGKRVRARLDQRNRVVPYFDRKAIESDAELLKGNEIAWVDDPVALFFTHIQGSAKIMFEDGGLLDIGYDDQNGHPYYAIGRKLIESGEVPVEVMSMQAIKQWLIAHPDRADGLLNTNPSYIFFQARETKPELGPLGSLGVPLTAQRSIAVDRQEIPLGAPVWISTQLPAYQTASDSGDTKANTDSQASQPGEVFQHLVFAQDTGGAIKGRARADLFWGSGEMAEFYAGKMRQAGRLFLLQPKMMQAQAESKQ